jgi:Ca2+-dependent lipid-binding protein
LNVVCRYAVLNGTKLAPDKGPIDALCKVMILEPGKEKTNVFKTDVIKKTENPVWAATFKMTL